MDDKNKLPNLTIRAFEKTSEERARVQAFFDQMGGESRAFFNRGNYNENKALSFFDPETDNHSSVYFMALDGDVMAGYMYLWCFDQSIVWLGIAVAEDWKGRHLGRALMKHAEAYARENGKGGIFLTTHAANIRGQALYERCGYKRMGMHDSGEILYLLTL